MTAKTTLILRLDIPEAAQALGISRALLYRRIKAGDIVSQKDGARSFITEVELRRYVESLNIKRAASGDANLPMRPLDDPNWGRRIEYPDDADHG